MLKPKKNSFVWARLILAVKFLIVCALPGCSSRMSGTETWLRDSLEGTSYETVVPLYLIGNAPQYEIWYAIPEAAASNANRRRIREWLGSQPGGRYAKVYDELGVGTKVRVRDVRWVENSAVARFEIIVDVMGDSSYENLHLRGCFELGNSGVAIENVLAQRHQIASDADLGSVNVNTQYLRPLDAE